MILVTLCLLGSAFGQAAKRVVVLGIDGMDHAIATEMLARGELPNLAKLSGSGTFAPLLPTNPAQSPTSWATLTTGRNPGETGIFGFLYRRIVGDDIVPELALAERGEREILGTKALLAIVCGVLLVSMLPALIWRRRSGRIASLVLLVALGALAVWFVKQVPKTVPEPRNRRSGDAFWQTFDREGIPVTTLFAPVSFPAPVLTHPDARLLAGLGVPDLLQTPGTTVVYLEDVGSGAVTQMGGRRRALRLDPRGAHFTATLEGPRSPLDGRSVDLTMTLRATDDQDAYALEILDQASLVVREDGFSEHVALTFRMGAFFAVRGITRFRMLQTGAHPVLYQEPLQFDPRHPNPIAPITWPRDLGEHLATDGLFETLGWATATNPCQDGLISDDVLLDDARSIFARQRTMVLRELREGRWRVMFAVLSTMDRIQHMFWRDKDPEHPRHDASLAASRDPIGDEYRQVDALVGDVAASLSSDDVLLVVSDHGFAPFRRAVNLNKWLAEEGYLVARQRGQKSLEENLGKSTFSTMDWKKTQAYSLGLGRIWINLAGREPFGSVERSRKPVVAEELRTKLLALRDGGRPVVRSVALAEELYGGPRMSESADLIIGFERGYRISWNSCLGGLDEPAVFDNTSAWSGDHCSVDPSLVQGVLFCNRPLHRSADDAGVVDIYPTLRALLGLTADGTLRGKDLR